MEQQILQAWIKHALSVQKVFIAKEQTCLRKNACQVIIVQQKQAEQLSILVLLVHINHWKAKQQETLVSYAR